MLKQKKIRHPFFFSLLLHAFILAVLIVSFEFSTTNYVLKNETNAKVMDAVMMDLPPSKIQAPKMAPPPPKKQVAPKKITPPPKAKKIPEPIVKQKAIAIPDPKSKKELIEKQLLEDVKKHVVPKKKQHQQKELEKAFEKELKAAAAKSLQQDLLNEQNRLTNISAAHMQGVVDKYKALIQQAIGQRWIVPNGVDKSLTSELLIRVGAGGTVLDVQLVKSSGDASLDRSARAAVFKASPLPVPTDAEEFAPFRQFILKVKPENIL